MSIGKAIAIWAPLLIAGAGGGWAARGRYDRKSMEAIATQALMVEMSSGQFRTQTVVFKKGPEPPPTREERDAELRCVVYDPEAIALPATIQEVNRTGDFASPVYELQLATARGAFRIDWRGGKLPRVGQTGEVFGRITDRHPLAGSVTELEPGWFEPAGTIERVRHAKMPSRSEDACGALTPKACEKKGTAFLLLSPADERSALPLLDAACARGSADACTNLGGLLTDTADLTRHDERRAIDAFKKGCELGNNGACCGAGSVLENGSVMGPPVAVDFGAAARLYRVGCDNGEMICCVGLGNLYVAGGPGLAKNKKSAAQYYRKARKLGDRDDQDGD
jgi:hypothetical protein